MFRARDLHRRAVVDVEEGTKVGQIDDLLLDPDGQHVAGYIVQHGSTLLGQGARVLVPAAAVHAVGPDAMTVRRVDAAEAAEDTTALPRLSDLVGHKIVSEGGRLLGVVEDVLLDDDGMRILGYAMESAGAAGRLGALTGQHHEATRFIRADGNLRVGRDMIIASNDAVIEGGDEAPSPRFSHDARRSATDVDGATTRETPVVVERETVPVDQIPVEEQQVIRRVPPRR